MTKKFTIQDYLNKLEYFELANRYYEFGYDEIADDATPEYRKNYFQEHIPLVKKLLENVSNTREVASIFEQTPSEYAVDMLPVSILSNLDFACVTRGNLEVYPHLSEEIRNNHFILAGCFEKIDNTIYHNFYDEGENINTLTDKAKAVFKAVPDSMRNSGSFNQFIAQNSAYFRDMIPESFFKKENTENILESLSRNNQQIILESFISKISKEQMSEKAIETIVNKVPLGYSQLSEEFRDNQDLAVNAIKKNILNAVKVPTKHFEDVNVQNTFLKALSRFNSPSKLGKFIFWDDHDTLLDITKNLPQFKALGKNIVSEITTLYVASDIAKTLITVQVNKENEITENIKPKV